MLTCPKCGGPLDEWTSQPIRVCGRCYYVEDLDGDEVTG